MSNLPDYILAGVGRMNDFLPSPAAVKPLSPQVRGQIPFGLTAGHDFLEAEIFGTSFLLVGMPLDADSTPSVVARQRDVLKCRTGLEPIFVFKHLASYLFPRYAKKNINMVVGDRQLFLPAIYLIAGREMSRETAIRATAPAAFQLLVLMQLQKKNTDGMTTREVAAMLNLSYATANRCVRWMLGNGFITLVGGKEKRIEWLCQGRSLWEKALPFLSSPIDFVARASDAAIVSPGLVSGRNALAEYTLLSPGRVRMAISREVYKDLKKQGVIGDECDEPDIEVWKYDPHLLSEQATVDKLSLYLLLRGSEDERVQIELENLINEMAW